jgi:HD-GYP domain-containing protein (c-di-GMP phosphodiesterase class II)
MDSIKISIIKLFRKTIILNLCMMFAITIFLGVLLFSMVRYNYESREVINVLGNQRALTQSLAKNSSSAYALLDSLDNSNYKGSIDSIFDKLSYSRNKLVEDRYTFQMVFNSLKDGNIQITTKKVKFKGSLPVVSENIDIIDRTWPQFSKSIDIIVHAKEINSEVIDAAIFINEKNEVLLNSSNLITQTIINEAKNKLYLIMGIVSLLLLLSFIILTISLFNLHKYILLPLDELYRGISDMGIINSGMKNQFRSDSPQVQLITSEVNEVFDKLTKLISLIENINQNSSFNEILQFIYHSFSSFIPYTYIGIALITDDGKNLKASYGLSSKEFTGLPENLLGKKTPIDETSLARVIETGDPRIINDLKEYTANKPYRGYNKVILNAGVRASITLPLKFNNKPIGIIFFSSDKRNVYTNEHAKFLQTIANSISIAFQKNIFIEELLYSNILALAKLAESRDEDTGDHLNRMKIYSTSIAQFLFEESKYKSQITTEFIDNIEKFSPLHDIGKVGIRDNILLKPAKLTPEEFEEMKHHAIYGGQVLRAADENMAKSGRSVFKLGIEIAEGHHEKWNGTGYPDGKKGEEIPLSARIVAVADVFDALTSRRPYKEPFSVETAHDMIFNASGTHFDPEIVRVFEKNKSRIINIYNDFKNTVEN